MEHWAEPGDPAFVREERLIPESRVSVWSLWTTKEGLQSWWAPEGFVMEVRALEVRRGGPIEFVYEDASTAADPEWRQTMSRKGLPTSWVARGTFMQVARPRRLAFRQQLDFGPRTRPQEYRMVAEFRAVSEGTVVKLAAAASPSRHWDLLGRANLRGQLDRLQAVLSANKAGRAAEDTST